MQFQVREWQGKNCTLTSSWQWRPRYLLYYPMSFEHFIIQTDNLFQPLYTNEDFFPTHRFLPVQLSVYYVAHYAVSVLQSANMQLSASPILESLSKAKLSYTATRRRRTVWDLGCMQCAKLAVQQRASQRIPALKKESMERGNCCDRGVTGAEYNSGLLWT